MQETLEDSLVNYSIILVLISLSRIIQRNFFSTNDGTSWNSFFERSFDLLITFEKIIE